MTANNFHRIYAPVRLQLNLKVHISNNSRLARKSRVDGRRQIRYDSLVLVRI